MMEITILILHSLTIIQKGMTLGAIVKALTFKDGTDVFPYGYGAGPVELSQRELHVEERDAAEDGHQDVGDEEGACMERRGVM